MKAEGRVFKFGDNVDTDVIIPARYLNTADHKELASHCMEDLDTTFTQRVKPGDIVVTQDYGLASMCLAKCARVLNQNGLEYTADNMEALLLRRYENKKLLRAEKHPKGTPKRTKDQDITYRNALERILQSA